MEEARARGDNSGAALHGEYLLQVLRELNAHDRLTRGHSERVRAYAEMLGEELKLNEEDMGKLRWAALLHDVGKLEVPEHVLNKDDRPTDDEWAMLQSHPGHGGRMLEPLQPWLGDWVHAADQHHLRWDGNGYPLDLAGNDIAMAGRLVAIADAYDVMTSARSYKAPLSSEVARHELTANAGSQFDPAMVRAFLNIGLGKLRAVAGPLAWISNAVGSTQVPVPVATAAVTTAATAAAAASAVVIAALTGVLEPGPELGPLAHRVVETTDPAGIVVVDLEKNSIEDQSLMIEISALGEGTISFEVGGAAHGQVLMGIVESADWSRAPEMSSMIVTYVPALNYYGQDSFDFLACDEAGSCDTATVAISVAPENDAPSATADTAEGVAGSIILVDSLANDSDVDDTKLRLVSAVADSGRVSVIDGQIQFVADPDFSGTVEIEYIVADPSGETSVGTVTIEVLPRGAAPAAPPTTTTTTSPTVADDPPITIASINERPVASAPGATIAEDATPGQAVLSISATDSDGDSLSYAIVAGDPGGTFAIENAGNLFLAGPLDYESTPSYDLTMSVTDGTVVVPVTATVLISDVDEDPTAGDDALATTEDNPIAIPIGVNDSDPEGAAITFSVPATSNFGATLTEAGGVVTYSAVTDWSGSDSFTYAVTDPAGNLSNVATVTITVSPVNDAPVTADDGGVGFTTPEDTLITTYDVTANDTDVDDAVDPASITVLTAPATGTLVNNGDGSFDFDPAPAWSGTATFTYTISDPGALTSIVATVTLAVTGVRRRRPLHNDRG